MSSHIYLIRHGDKVKKIGDPPLSEKGVRQAKQTGKHLNDYSIEKILSSPALRCAQTAKYISKVLGLGVIISELLKERANWGDDPNQSFENFVKMWEKASTNRNWIPPVGDSSKNAGKRLNKFINSNMRNAENIAIITHGGIITDFLRNEFTERELKNQIPDFEGLADSSIPECSITILTVLDGYKFKLEKMASTNHLINN